jgi:mono/diheme cytochrome c family protein
VGIRAAGLIGAIALSVAPILAPRLAAQTASPTFTSEQADRGRASYQHWCQTCHGSELDNGEFGGPPLKGSWFNSHWGQSSVGALFTYVKGLMPPDNPAGLNDTTYVDMLAFILRANGYPAGNSELPPDTNALDQMTLRR